MIGDVHLKPVRQFYRDAKRQGDMHVDDGDGASRCAAIDGALTGRN